MTKRILSLTLTLLLTLSLFAAKKEKDKEDDKPKSKEAQLEAQLKASQHQQVITELNLMLAQATLTSKEMDALKSKISGIIFNYNSKLAKLCIESEIPKDKCMFDGTQVRRLTPEEEARQTNQQDGKSKKEKEKSKDNKD